jgi:hypothetical protein
MNTQPGAAPRASVSLPAIISLVAALFSFATGAFWGFILAVIAIIFGIIGVVMALSPKVRGGFISTVSLLAGSVGMVFAVIKAIMWLL